MTTPRTDRLNVLFIMADQHRFDYLGCAGADFIDTPHLDRLAERGTRFSQCTTNCPVCAPARIALASGLQPHRVGALNNNAFLPRRVPTYYQRLRDHGYRVGCVGKLDLAKPDPYNGRYGDRPCAYSWGFTHPEECEGKMHASSSATPIGPYTHWLAEQGLLQTFHEDGLRRREQGWTRACFDSPLPAEAFEDAYIGRRAREWVAGIPDDFPWHLFVSFVGPHDPYDPPTSYADRYRDRPVPEAVQDTMEGKPAWVKQRRRNLSEEEVCRTRRQYCAAITLIDDQVGRLLDAVDARGQRDRTIIVYVSDHGEMLGDHGLYTKCFGYEASLRVPLIVAGPGIAEGEVADALVELIDLNPTVCDLAGVEPCPDLDARSFAPVLRDASAAHRDNQFSIIQNHRCLRTATHKLIENENGGPELYNLEHDPDEQTNLAGERPEVCRDLAGSLHRRMSEGGPQR